MGVNRRQFFAAAGLPALAFGVSPTSGSEAAPVDVSADRTVRLSGDGLSLTPPQYAALLTRLLEQQSMTPDSYSLGGIVEELEADCARMLGKERAIFMPTGTLANHMAVRALAGGPSRAIVQEDSHFYQDEGDCAQTLSSLTLLPLAKGKATFTANIGVALSNTTHYVDMVSDSHVAINGVIRDATSSADSQRPVASIVRRPPP